MRPSAAGTGRAAGAGHVHGSIGLARKRGPIAQYVLDTYKGRRAVRKLTITVEDEICSGLLAVVGKRRISGFLNDLGKPHVLRRDLEAEYSAMASDEAREAEAAEWVEGVLMDSDESRR